MLLQRAAVGMALVFAGHAGAIARQAAPPVTKGGAPEGVILGRVIDAAAGTPISGVVVMTLGAAGRDPAPFGSPAPPGRPQAIVTDSQGRFVFRNLVKGTYTLAVNVGGNGFSPSGFIVTGMGHQIGAYLNGGYGQRRPNGPLQPIEIDDGDRITDAVIRLWKGGAISGAVSDEAGEPLVDIVVAAVQRTADGRLLTGPTTKTDDRGMYRVGTLASGEYVIVVPQTQVSMPASNIESLLTNPPDPGSHARLSSVGLPPPSGGGFRLGTAVLTPPPQMDVTNALPAVRQSERSFAYQTTFHPSAVSSGRATVIPLRSGEERTEVNVQLQPVRAVRVSGTLMDSSGPVANFGVHLVPADTGDGASVLEVGTAATDASGAFLFPTVPAGNYVLHALRTSPQPVFGSAPEVLVRSVSDAAGAWATQPLTVGEDDVASVVLMLRPGVQVSGRVEFRGAAEVPPADRMKQLAMTLTRPRPLFRSMSATMNAVFDQSGGFTIAGVVPGQYLLNVRDVPGWTLQSITAGGGDVTDEVFAVRDDMKDVVIVFTDRGAELTGIVSGVGGAAASDASVFLFPIERTRWADARVSTRSFRVARVGRDRTFRVPNLLAGEYFVLAARDEIAREWPDARFLARLSSLARTVRVDAGQKAQASLQMVDVR